MPTLLLLCSSSCQSTSYQSPVSTSHTRAPPPPESSPYLLVRNCQDRATLNSTLHLGTHVIRSDPLQAKQLMD